ncbi:MAG: choice-of-anchor A family protein [Bacteroidota bacterium]|nr:choice-of-anchor A family protein [Bacteroidota bacterium]
MKKLFYFAFFVLFSFVNVFAKINSYASVTKVDKYVSVDLPAPYNETAYAGTFLGSVGTATARFYCIDLTHELSYNSQYQDVSSTSSKITYILNNYYPYKQLPYTNSLSESYEAAAIQLAIWNITDGLKISSCSPNTSNKDAQSIINRALAIVQDAENNAGTIQPFKTLLINMSSQSFKAGSPVQFFVETYNEVGAPIAGAQVKLTVNEGTLSSSTVTTNSAGVAGPVTLNAGPNNATTITATATVSIPGGTQYYNVKDPNGKQKLVIATPVLDTKTVSSSVSWYNTVSLAVSKTSGTIKVKDGDKVDYEITVKNTSQVNATGVQVSDVLPAVLKYVSTDGSYDPKTGIWSVGSLAPNESKKIKVSVNAALGAPEGAIFNLGTAADYNLFVLNDLIQPSSDTQGKLAVAHDAELANYSVGDVLPSNSGNVLVVGRKLTYKSGRVYGDVAFGSFIDTTHWNLSDGKITQSSPIDFNAASLYLNNLSSQLAVLEQNGTSKFEYGQISLTGTNQDINRFNISASDLSKCNDFLIDVPANSTVLINVSGNNIDWKGGFALKGATNSNVLINFFEASDLKISSIEVKASILAPKATLDFPSGLISGQVIAYNVKGSGQFNNVKFIGKIALEMTITNIAELVAVDQPIEICPSLKAMAQVSSPFNLTGINKHTSAIPDKMDLMQNYPNPFNPSTSIRFEIAKGGYYTLKVFNALGKEITTLAQREFTPGTYNVNFNASSLSSGVYMYQLLGNNVNITRKMILSK